MNNRMNWMVLVSVVVLCLGVATVGHAQQGDMSFFVTSAGSGKGADLGGLAGADQHCQMLAQAAGGRQDVARVSQHAGRGRRQRA